MRKTKSVNDRSKLELYHSSKEFFFETAINFCRGGDVDEIREAFEQGRYHWVFTFEPSSLTLSEDIENQLEAVFGASQNLEEYWRPEHPCRSTSVGDVIKVGNEYWIIAGIGFQLGWRDEPEKVVAASSRRRSKKTSA